VYFVYGYIETIDRQKTPSTKQETAELVSNDKREKLSFHFWSKQF
jgi:hypothetical protein